MNNVDKNTQPPDFARDWVNKRYASGHPDLVGVPEPHWRAAVLFCDTLAKAAGTRDQIFIVPASHIADDYGPGRIGVCYEGHTQLAEDIQLGHDHVIGFHYSHQFHDGDCYLECYNHWSTIVVQKSR